MSGVEPKTGLRRLTALNAETAAAKSFRPSAAVPCVRWVAAALRRARSWTCCCARATTSCSIASSTDSALIRPARRLSPPCASFDRLRRCCAAIFAFRCSSRSAASSAATRARIRDWCALVVPGGPDRTGPGRPSLRVPRRRPPPLRLGGGLWLRFGEARRARDTGSGARAPRRGFRRPGLAVRDGDEVTATRTGDAVARRGDDGAGRMPPPVGAGPAVVPLSVRQASVLARHAGTGLGLSAHPLRSRGGRRPAPA